MRYLALLLFPVELIAQVVFRRRLQAIMIVNNLRLEVKAKLFYKQHIPDNVRWKKLFFFSISKQTFLLGVLGSEENASSLSMTRPIKNCCYKCSLLSFMKQILISHFQTVSLKQSESLFPTEVQFQTPLIIIFTRSILLGKTDLRNRKQKRSRFSMESHNFLM